MPSIRSCLIRFFIRIVSPKGRVRKRSIAQLRQKVESDMGRMPLPKGVKIEAVTIGGVPGEWVVPANADPNRVLLYLHGGGFFIGSCKAYRSVVARFANALGCRALHLSYRLAPEHPFPAGVEDCFAVYKALLASGVLPQSLIVGGESAGGALTLTTLMQAREKGLPMPAGAFCLSPVTDLTLSSNSITTRNKAELFYTKEELLWVRELYAKDQDLQNPLISPAFAEYHDFPPLFIQAADTEMLRDDAIRIADKAKAAGIPVTLKVWEGMFHAFQLIPFLPESRQALEEMTAFATFCFEEKASMN